MTLSASIPQWTADELAELHRLRNDGMIYKNIAKAMGRSMPSVIHKWQRTNPRMVKVTYARSVKATEYQVRGITLPKVLRGDWV